VAVLAAGCLTAVAAAALSLASAQGAEPDHATLADPSQRVLWQGRHFENTSSPPTPETCGATDCDEFRLRVKLPAGVWRDHPGGVQVGIQWHDPPEAQDLDLYVYGPDGSLAAKSDGFFASTAEVVILRRARNGVYRVVVVPRSTTDRGLDYHGLAEVERFPARDPVRRLLPDLVARPPRNLMFAIGGYLFDPASQAPQELSPLVTEVQGGSSCYPEEMAELGARRCLRFDQIIANVGSGPFELRYRMEGVATDQQLRQRIYRSDGSHYDRTADTYELHPAHAHFHYKNFARSKLWAATADGDRKGSRPVRVGRKNGFCMIDVEDEWFGAKGDAARAYYFPRCNAPTERDESGTYMTNGISRGWADVYNWYLADQFIEVSGVPDGCYVLETTADATDTIVEGDNSNNVASALIKLKGDTARFVKRSRARFACG
jgi:hypothetical protein